MAIAVDPTLRCRQCNADLAVPVICPACGTMQELSNPLDHFQLFGLPRCFSIDETALKASFLKITRQIHPDRYSAASEAERQLATRLSAEVNEAMAALKDPLRRAEYLLELTVGKSPEEDRRVPQEVLGEVLMMREEIEEARATNDADALAAMTRQLQTRHRQAAQEMSDLADRLKTADQQERTRLREVINTVKYYAKTLDELQRG